MIDPDYYCFTHPELGQIIGRLRRNDIVQFRGIPFASIPGRFRQSILSTSLPYRPFDAREPGPYCPQAPLFFPEYLSGPLADDGIYLQPPLANELECLNLNITVPRSLLEGCHEANIPILLFIHGGAFVGGSSSAQVAGRELYDGYEVVKKSVERHQPVILVSINYRIGPLGFMTSRELRTLNALNNEIAGNCGLHDQRQALDWCHKFIAGFGGDREEITIAGTSAGGASCEYLLRFPNPKFRRVVCSSGTMTGFGPETTEFHQAVFEHVVKTLASNVHDDEELKIGTVMESPVDDLVRAYPPSCWSPWVDGQWVRGKDDTWNCTASIDLMLGECTFEQDVTRNLLSTPAPYYNEVTTRIETGEPGATVQSKETHMERVMAMNFRSSRILKDAGDFPISYPDIMEAYKLDGCTSIPNEASALSHHASLLADVLFRLPPSIIAEKLNINGDIYLYDMQATNPYPKWPVAYSKANHGVNDVFLFNIAPDQVPLDEKEGFDTAVEDVTAAWLNFVNGKRPWDPVDKTRQDVGPVFVFRDSGKSRQYRTVEEAVGVEDAKRFALLRRACV